MTITEVSKKFGFSQDTLRYYEKIGLIETVQKNSRGVRDYQESDIKRIEFLKCMRSAGLTIDVLVRYVQLFNQGDDTIPERKDLLVQQKEILEVKVAEMQATLDKLKFKIDNYDERLLKKEQAAANVLVNV